MRTRQMSIELLRLNFGCWPIKPIQTTPRGQVAKASIRELDFNTECLAPGGCVLGIPVDPCDSVASYLPGSIKLIKQELASWAPTAPADGVEFGQILPSHQTGKLNDAKNTINCAAALVVNKAYAVRRL